MKTPFSVKDVKRLVDKTKIFLFVNKELERRISALGDSTRVIHLPFFDYGFM